MRLSKLIWLKSTFSPKKFKCLNTQTKVTTWLPSKTFHPSQILNHYKLHFISQLLKKMGRLFHTILNIYIQINISWNINHKLSTSKNKNKNIQSSRIRTFNLQVLKINKKNCTNLSALLLNWKKIRNLNYVAHDMIIASPKD